MMTTGRCGVRHARRLLRIECLSVATDNYRPKNHEPVSPTDASGRAGCVGPGRTRYTRSGTANRRLAPGRGSTRTTVGAHLGIQIAARDRFLLRSRDRRLMRACSRRPWRVALRAIARRSIVSPVLLDVPFLSSAPTTRLVVLLSSTVAPRARRAASARVRPAFRARSTASPRCHGNRCDRGRETGRRAPARKQPTEGLPHPGRGCRGRRGRGGGRPP